MRGMPYFATSGSVSQDRPINLTRERIMGKGNNSRKDDKKNKKVKQDSKKPATKPANKR
jgi:hypothetical protein